MRRLPLGSHLKCLTRLVTYTTRRSIPAFSSEVSRILPAGPTKGLPSRSSRSPGCSPTSITRARKGPSPKTVWLPRFQRSHARQPAAAWRSFASVGLRGTSGAAEWSESDRAGTPPTESIPRASGASLELAACERLATQETRRGRHESRGRSDRRSGRGDLFAPRASREVRARARPRVVGSRACRSAAQAEYRARAGRSHGSGVARRGLPRSSHGVFDGDGDPVAAGGEHARPRGPRRPGEPRRGGAERGSRALRLHLVSWEARSR